MFLPIFYLLISVYLIVRGGNEAGIWSIPGMLQGLLMLGAGICLFLEYIV